MVSLYPNLSWEVVGEEIYQALMDSDSKFEGINYKEGVRYLAMVHWCVDMTGASLLTSAVTFSLERTSRGPHSVLPILDLISGQGSLEKSSFLNLFPLSRRNVSSLIASFDILYEVVAVTTQCSLMSQGGEGLLVGWNGIPF